MFAIRTLLPFEWNRYERHLLRLDGEDRRLRFGSTVKDEGIRAFVRRLDIRRTLVLGHLDAAGEVVGAVQIFLADARSVELAFSVEAAFRVLGLGTALMERALLWARNRGLRQVYLHCWTDNRAMCRLAHRAGMALRTSAADTEASLRLASPSPRSLLREWLAMYAAGLDLTARALARISRWASVAPSCQRIPALLIRP
jgi:RimJ/RimL family protein N-acetyltransferase